LLGCQALAPCGYSHRYPQWTSRALDVDLDGVQPAERPPRNDLSTPLVGSGQQNQQLSLRGVPHAVKAT
jgi:hypothetical protein